MLDLDSVCRIRIKAQRIHEAGHIPQWHPCQQLGIGLHMCHNIVACVRYSQLHPTTTYRLASSANLNYGYWHAANYRNCAVYKQQHQLLMEKAMEKQPLLETSTPEPCPTAPPLSRAPHQQPQTQLASPMPETINPSPILNESYQSRHLTPHHQPSQISFK